MGELVERGLDATRDVEHVVGDGARGGKHVAPRDVADVDEIHRLVTGAVDHGRETCVDALHPPHEHFGVRGVASIRGP